MVTVKKWKEALALYDRAGQHLESSSREIEKALKGECDRLKADLERSKFSALAHSVLDEGATDDTQTTKLVRSKKVCYLFFNSLLS